MSSDDETWYVYVETSIRGLFTCVRSFSCLSAAHAVVEQLECRAFSTNSYKGEIFWLPRDDRYSLFGDV